MTELPGAPIRVIAADDSYLIREFLTLSLSEAPEVELVDVCENAIELDAAIDSRRPDVVITDIRMPPSNADEGIRIAARLRETHPELGVVVLSQYAEPSYAVALFEQGSSRRAYLLKERVRDRSELIASIQAVARGDSVIDPAVVEVLIEGRARDRDSQLSGLTPRERELLAEIATGKSNSAIADSRSLTKRAVEKHVNSIFRKLGLFDATDVSRRVQATLIYLAERDGGRGGR